MSATPDEAREQRWLWRGFALAAAALMALAALLWARYGGAVFFETMANAWAYCF